MESLKARSLVAAGARLFSLRKATLNLHVLNRSRAAASILKKSERSRVQKACGRVPHSQTLRISKDD